MTEIIDKLVGERRARLSKAQADGLAGPVWGLALSGGGIRSATFCFGLLHSLARNKVFHKFDLMSTVSGGGYIGSMIGRLFQRAVPKGTASASEVMEEALGDADSRWFTSWLRANGRYLIPNGTRDSFFAAATYARNLIAVHFEIALIALVLGVILCGVDIGVWQFVNGWSEGIPAPDRWGAIVVRAVSGVPPVWLALVPMALVWGVIAGAYWIYPSDTEPAIPTWRLGASLVVAALLAAICMLWERFRLALPLAILLPVASLMALWIASAAMGFWIRPGIRTTLSPARAVLVGLVCAGLALSWMYRDAELLAPHRQWLEIAEMLGLLWLFGVGTASALRLRCDNAASTRRKLTAALGNLLLVASGVFVLGGLDYLAWQLSLGGREFQGQVALGIATLGAILRVLLPKAAELPRSFPPEWRQVVGSIVSVAGLMILAGLFVFWISVIHTFATHRIFLSSWLIPRELNFDMAWYALGAIGALAIFLSSSAGANIEFLNKSSLFPFYKSRLVRGYLGATNGARFGNENTPVSPPLATESMPAERSEKSRRDVFTVQEDDDIEMRRYLPHRVGAPVHLINVCANQTTDPRGGLFNRDRKGTIVTVGAGHVRIGIDKWEPLPLPRDRSMTLGSWMAISGAAVSPGMGGATRPGIAALAMLAGIRLGYWWQSGTRNGPLWPFGKYKLLLSELLGRFELGRDAPWFLSDGGHFENTATYALLRERCQLIVAADCGADPRYAFGDVENLVRKARIDLQTDIQFLKPKRPLNKGWESFGSLSDIASSESTASLALASVHYAGQTEPAYLILVKPTMRAGLPVDLVNFKADNPAFPQQPTTDQFFDEAQWESYFRLGKILGDCLSSRVLATVADVARECFAPDDGALTQTSAGKPAGPAAAAAASAAAVPAKRLPARVVATGAVTASVSLGAIASLALTAYQAIDADAKQRRESRKIDSAEVKELSKLYAELISAEAENLRSKTTLSLVVSLSRLADHVCPGPSVEAYRASPQIRMIVAEALRSCQMGAVATTETCRRLKDQLPDSPICLLPPERPRCVPHYWIRDYAEESNNCRTGLTPLRMYAVTGNAVEAEKEPPVAPPPVAATPAGPSTAGTSPVREPPGRQCVGKTVYVQIYGAEQRERARGLRPIWRSLGASVPPIEDVVQSARQNKRAPPVPYAAPTIISHEPSSAACAEALKEAAEKQGVSHWAIRPLPTQLKGTRDVLEVWLPPGESLASAR